MPIIILEGVDKAGKSTLGRKLCKMFNAEYQHYSKPDKDPFEYFYPAIAEAKNGKFVVCDRHCLGEIVYSTVKGEPSQWKPGDYELMLSMLEDINATIIHVWENFDNLSRRLKELGDSYVKENEMLEIQGLFDKEVRRISINYPGITCLSFRPTQNFINIIPKYANTQPRS